MSASAFQDSALLGAVFEAAVDAIVVSDQSGLIRRANEATYRMFGYESGTLNGQNVSLLMPETDARAHDRYMARHLKTGEKHIIGTGREVEGKRSDGTLFPLHISVGRTDAKGEPVFIAILHDLTQRVTTQQALARSLRLDALGQMTSGISHDFNNLLTIIIGNLELLEPRISDPKVKPMLADALEAAELGADLTERLTAFARRGDLKAEPFDLNEGCKMALAILKRTLGRNYRIKTRFVPDLPLVRVDPTHLQTAIMNLALNARDAMPDSGEITFVTEVAQIDDSYVAQEVDVEQGVYVRLSVADTGTGMSVEAQRCAFEPFFTTKAVGGGTGLGLAMVYGFMRQSGGHVTLYSEEDHGSTFALYFPIENAAEQTTKADVRAETQPRGQGELVLVVDDNPQVLALSVERIADLGYRTAKASDGNSAYRMLVAGLDPDLVFSDVIMPGTMDGYALVNRVEEEFPDIKVLLTSGHVDETKDQKRNPEVLRKPYRQAELAQVLHAILGSD